MTDSEKQILVIGDAMIDSYHFGQVNRISPEAPIPVFLEVGKKKYSPGGASNVAVNIAAIGLKTGFMAVIGNDEYGRILKGELEDCGVDTSYLFVLDNYRTISKLRYIGPGNQQILRVDTEDVTPIDKDRLPGMFEYLTSRIDEIGMIVLSDYMKGFLTKETTQKIIRIANDHKVPVIVDVKDKNVEKYKGALLLKPNRLELANLSGCKVDTIDEVVEAAKILCQKAECKYVLATLGAEGMVLVDEKGLIRRIKSFAREVFDVTGAGDTSIAYLAAEMAIGSPVDEAMLVANYAAGVQVSKVGTSVVYPDEVFAAMQEKGQNISGKALDYYDSNGLKPIRRLKAEGKKIVFTNGCFDILHAGHITYLREAKRLGDVLVIGLNSDDSVKRLKGESRPVNNLFDRQLLLTSLEFVDFVVPFEEDTPLELIKQVMPDVLVKGGDYIFETIVGAQEVLENGGTVEIIPLVEGKSTTGIIQKIST